MDPKVPADWAKLAFMVLIIGFVLHQFGARVPLVNRAVRSSYGS